MLDMTMIKERLETKEDCRYQTDELDDQLLLDARALLEEVEKTPWRVRGLIGTGRIMPDWQMKTPLLRHCHLVGKVGRLGMAIISLDDLMVELLLAEIATLCIDWVKEGMEYARRPELPTEGAAGVQP